MKARILFSSGKDSSLAAILLEPFFDVELVTVNFGVSPTYKAAQKTAFRLGFSHKVLMLPPSWVKEAATMLIEDGFPRRAINHLHRAALETICSEPDTFVVADGTRRDDRAPMLMPGEVRSLEDRHNVMYMRPLLGYGRSAVDVLVDTYLQVIQRESEEVDKADYEVELRSFIRKQYNQGDSIVEHLFPKHIQSHVINRKYSDTMIQ
jgi:predicted subunit of tRNA(5-methylaminomethyl-2-thiouridylate) methyltransferase